MNQEEVFIKVVDKMNELGFPHMLTGGMAVLYYGKPRTTHDIDIVLEVSEENISEIVNAFKDDFYISEEGIKDAILHRTMFNMIHLGTGIKIDFWLLGNIQYDRMTFQRRIKKEIFGRMVYVSPAEDTVIRKLLWYKESGISKHFDDVVGILQIQGKSLDYGYIEKWTKELKILGEWKKAKQELENK